MAIVSRIRLLYNLIVASQLLYAAVEGGEDSQQEPPGLCSVVLEPMPEKEVPITDPFLDLREVYLRELFVPNRFSAHTLRKALGVSYIFYDSGDEYFFMYLYMLVYWLT